MRLQLSGEVLGTSDIGLPLADSATAALLPANVEAFAAGLERDVADVRLYAALREAAHQRLFAHVPWLKGALLSAVETYARGITLDADAIQRAMGSVDPSDPNALQQAMSEGVLEREDSPAQEAALKRLETMLALVEGWVANVVDRAIAGRIPDSAALAEAFRRRRAEGGPAEQTFATLVGLELRPRKQREAAVLWQELTENGGIEVRDEVWQHPDLFPGEADLDNPTPFLHRTITGEEAPNSSSAGSVDGFEVPDDISSLEELLRKEGTDKSSDAPEAQADGGDSPSQDEKNRPEAKDDDEEDPGSDGNSAPRG